MSTGQQVGQQARSENHQHNQNKDQLMVIEGCTQTGDTARSQKERTNGVQLHQEVHRNNGFKVLGDLIEPETAQTQALC